MCCMAQAVGSKSFGSVVLSALSLHAHLIADCTWTPRNAHSATARAQRVTNALRSDNLLKVVRTRRYRKSLAEHILAKRKSCFSIASLLNDTTNQLRKLSGCRTPNIGFFVWMLMGFDLGPTSHLDHVYLGCTQWATQGTSTDVKSKDKISKTSQVGSATWKFTLKSVLNAVANWCIGRSTNLIRFPHFVWAITKINPEDLELFGNCQRLVSRLCWNACSWQEMVDQIYFGHLITWQDQSPSGTEHAISDSHVYQVRFITHTQLETVSKQ